MRPGPIQDPTVGEVSWSEAVGKELRSVKLFTGGLGPEGPTQNHQSLTLFEDGRFEWNLSDVTRRGTYEMSDITERGYLSTYKGEFDTERRILTWEGIEFEIP